MKTVEMKFTIVLMTIFPARFFFCNNVLSRWVRILSKNMFDIDIFLLLLIPRRSFFPPFFLHFYFFWLRMSSDKISLFPSHLIINFFFCTRFNIYCDRYIYIFIINIYIYIIFDRKSYVRSKIF